MKPGYHMVSGLRHIDTYRLRHTDTYRLASFFLKR